MLKLKGLRFLFEITKVRIKRHSNALYIYFTANVQFCGAIMYTLTLPSVHPQKELFHDVTKYSEVLLSYIMSSASQ